MRHWRGTGGWKRRDNLSVCTTEVWETEEELEAGEEQTSYLFATAEERETVEELEAGKEEAAQE